MPHLLELDDHRLEADAHMTQARVCGPVHMHLRAAAAAGAVGLGHLQVPVHQQSGRPCSHRHYLGVVVAEPYQRRGQHDIVHLGLFSCLFGFDNFNNTGQALSFQCPFDQPRRLAGKTAFSLIPQKK